MGKYKIEYDRENCIGAGTCTAVCPKNWELSAEDGKADFHQDEFDEGEDYDCNMEAAKVCPVNVIHIIDKKTGKKII
ncbi:ferredoxin [Candidatus Woesearchaeota archaeon]|nr:ferredoxin [Candidatus Woesearchaeota archaeon]